MQSHIYELGLLGGRCSDIRIRAFGRLYHLHRLVLIQSGFFRAMLCGGYAEDLAAASVAASLSQRNSQHGPQPPSSSSLHRDPDSDVVELHFDDPNISRAAFEYCIARLYGDGPKLVLPFWATPSSDHPFSPALTMRLSNCSDLQLPNLVIDKHSHPATPRFLLSLLATSIYLNIPSVTSQALTLVLCSVTPFTIIHYLRFAIGRGIEGTDLHRSASDVMLHDLDEWDWELEGPARTLDELARFDPSFSSSSRHPRTSGVHERANSVSDDLAADLDQRMHVSPQSPSSKHASTPPHTNAPGQHDRRASQPVHGLRSPPPPSGREHKSKGKKTPGFRDCESSPPQSAPGALLPEFNYGITADKIGEACVCWFARWGYDIFELECSMERERVVEIETWIRMCREDRDLARLTLLRDRLHTGDVDLLHTSMLARGRMPDPEERLPSPRLRVWSYPSMPSSWVRAMISSDGFFVPSELHRYEFAKKVVEFRRKQKALINVLDRLIEDWLRQDQHLTAPADNETPDSSKKMGGAPKASSSNASSSDAGDGFGFKAFRRAPSIGADDEQEEASTPLQEAWDDGVESITFSASLDDDEAEYEELFSTGIYYSHMPFQALNKISADISPTTGRPYTPLNVLQAALWVSNELRTQILNSAPAGGKNTAASNQEVEPGNEAGADSGPDDEEAEDWDHLNALGVSSSIHQFRDAFQSTIHSTGSQHRFSRSRSGTPMNLSVNPDGSLHSGSSAALGGLGSSPLMSGILGGGTAGLLNKRFYLVPSDDTVRFGDSLASVIGVTTGGSANSTKARDSDDERKGKSHAFESDPNGPSGTAAMQIPHTLPIPGVMHQDANNTLHQRRHRSHYYGIANDVATGRELGEYAYRHLPAVPDSSSRAASRHVDERDAFDSAGGEFSSHLHDPNQDAEGADADSHGSADVSPQRWSGYEPMRVGVEFFGIDKLQEKQRLYSPTFFYAGSVWNLYIQVVKKAKGIQLGIYLHRQSLTEQLPPPSAPTPEEGETTSGLATEAAWPGAPGGARSTQRGEPHGTPSREQGAAPGQRSVHQSTRGSVFGVAAGDESLVGEGGSSFFDTSLTSPIRVGGTGYAAGAGSTLTLPSGRTLTRLGGNSAGSPMRNSLLDPFASAEAEGSRLSTEGGSLASLSSLGEFGASLTRDTTAAGAGSSPAGGAGGDESRSRHSTGTQAGGGAARPPIVELYAGGPSVYQTCPLPPIPYRDPRIELRAYFSIHCPSPLGTALTKFSSGPDRFTVSQSWGWKSSSLLGTVHLENGDLASGRPGLSYRFRCVCSIGLI